MSLVATFASQASVATALLNVQITKLQVDLASIGAIENAADPDIAMLIADANAAQGSAQAASLAHAGILALLEGNLGLASGASPHLATNAVLLLVNSSSGVAMGADAASRLTRVQKNLLAIGI